MRTFSYSPAQVALGAEPRPDRALSQALMQYMHGRSYGKQPSALDPRQLRIGTEVEFEHTSEPRIARQIAMDHLVEDPHYYDKLLRMGL